MKESIRICCWIGIASLAVMVTACGPEEKLHSKGFHLPDGNVEAGRQTFVSLKCTRCHEVDGVQLPEEENEEGLAKLTLGGELYRVKSYGDLVTSVISPDHKLADEYRESLPEGKKPEDVISPMPVFNRELTVQELIDLVAFLHSRYGLIDPATDEYYYVMP